MLPPESLRTGGLTKKFAGLPSSDKATFFSLMHVRRVTDPFTLV